MSARTIIENFTNRWGARIAIGSPVTMKLPQGGEANGRVKSIDRDSEFARAYGPRVTLDNGMSGSIDDCRIGIGSRKITLKVQGNTPETMTWQEFIDANKDGMEDSEMREISHALAKGKSYIGGGGAAPSWTISPA